MQTNFLSFYLIFTFFDFCFQENTNEKIDKNIGPKEINNNKDLSRKEDRFLNEIDSLLNNMTEIYENRLSNLSEKINQLLDFKELINRKLEDKQIINGMINDLRLLKKEYTRNLNFSFMLFGLFLFINIIFSIYDFITYKIKTRKKQQIKDIAELLKTKVSIKFQ